MPDKTGDFFRTADLTSHRKPVSRDPERNKQADCDIIREMLPANLPPTYIQQSNVAEIRQYILLLERRENDEPVSPPYHLFEVQRALSPLLAVPGFLRTHPYTCQNSSESAHLIPNCTVCRLIDLCYGIRI
jgi:hypothetical protein